MRSLQHLYFHTAHATPVFSCGLCYTRILIQSLQHPYSHMVLVTPVFSYGPCDTRILMRSLRRPYFHMVTPTFLYGLRHICRLMQLDKRLAQLTQAVGDRRGGVFGVGGRQRSASPPRHHHSKSPPKWLSRSTEQAGYNRDSMRDQKDTMRERSFPKDKGFGNGASRVLAACAVCLGRHPHKIVTCDAPRTWDKAFDTLCKRVNRTLTMCDGRELCHDWQRDEGCSARHHDAKHTCSGCGSLSHGAQKCPRTQKN